MSKSKKRKVSEEHRTFNASWTNSFAFIADKTGLPVCLICSEKLANNKKSNVERHFQNKHLSFAQKYSEGDARKKAVLELMRNADQSKQQFSKWIKSANSTTYASFVAAQEIVKHGKPFTDGEYLKNSFIKISEHLFMDFKNKSKMSTSQSIVISKEILDELEAKITNRVLQKIETIVVKKCEEIFSCKGNEKRDDDLARLLKNEIVTSKSDWLHLESEIGKLNERHDHILGSVTYLASEYDDFLNEIKRINKQNSQLMQKMKSLEQIVTKFDNQQTNTEKQLEELEQYGRRENLEIHGIPLADNEDTGKIVQNVAKALKVQLSKSDISTSHRLFNSNLNDQHQKLLNHRDQQPSAMRRNQPPPIIVRFCNRDKRNEMFSKRLKLKSVSNEIYPKPNAEILAIRENLTKFRKFLFSEANKVKHALCYQFLWTRQGQILLRKDSTSRIIKISNLNDLARVRSSNAENSKRMYPH